MAMSRNMLALLSLIALAGCADGEPRDDAMADSLNRDLQLAPGDSNAVLNDRPANGGNTPGTAARPNNTQPGTSQPSTSRPATQTARSLASGTEFGAVTDTEISSNTHKMGQTIEARIASDVKDGSGRVVIPSGSVLTLEVTSIRESENKSDNTGTLTLAARTVSINGTSYNVNGNVTGLGTELRDRGTNAGDVAKVGAGAAAGAVVGRVLGGGSKGAIIGGVLGGAVGAQRANETQDRDVILPSGSTVIVTLDQTFTRST